MSTVECGGTHEGKGGGVTDTDLFERMQTIEGRESAKSQFSEDLQTLLVSQLCLAAL